MRMDIQITADHRRDLARYLGNVLADTYTLYLKTQGFHWNVTGRFFATLHEQFEGQYQELAEAVDAIAERIRALGFPAPASYLQFSELTSLKEETGTINAEEMVKQLVADHEAVIKTVRKVYPFAETAHDEATQDLLTQRLAYHEKTTWMLRSFLSE